MNNTLPEGFIFCESMESIDMEFSIDEWHRLPITSFKEAKELSNFIAFSFKGELECKAKFFKEDDGMLFIPKHPRIHIELNEDKTSKDKYRIIVDGEGMLDMEQDKSTKRGLFVILGIVVILVVIFLAVMYWE